MYKVTIGADPEFFMIDKNTNKPVVACRKFGGEKRAPMFLSPDGGYLEDGTAVEFNVSPSGSLAECREKIENLILVFLNQHKDYYISKYTTAQFSQAELESFPEAMQIGCSPDLFAYGLRIAPEISKFENRRFAGGHIHLGIDPWPEGLEKDLMVKFMDILLVLPVAHKWCDESRYPFYGHPGLYRETSYGIEHRSPDNWWCNPALYTSINEEYRNWLKGHIEKFDKCIQIVKQILEFDGHGAWLNDQLRKLIKTTRLEDAMGGMNGVTKSIFLREFRGWASSLHNELDSWWSERTYIQSNRNTEALKASSKQA